ncbi:hypothetical protein ATANTOWER_027700 [Ataeniobius toweri]|uniref:Uncharacterized protein n=1 Tax=Ataeniobius toweri TaxID=208326 RepID=A0ABU7CCR6_9TELE|nr:hypothetical protein [Ataeniobius toweri]
MANCWVFPPKSHRKTCRGGETEHLQLPAQKLKIDAATRWNSAYEMVERFLEQQSAICAGLLPPQVRKGGSSGDICTLSETDISHAKEMAKALRPLKDATNIMSDQLLYDTIAGFTEDDIPLVQEIKIIEKIFLRDTQVCRLRRLFSLPRRIAG